MCMHARMRRLVWSGDVRRRRPSRQNMRVRIPSYFEVLHLRTSCAYVLYVYAHASVRTCTCVYIIDLVPCHVVPGQSSETQCARVHKYSASNHTDLSVNCTRKYGIRRKRSFRQVVKMADSECTRPSRSGSAVAVSHSTHSESASASDSEHE